MHFKEQDSVASHCLRLRLGSLAEPRFNEPCTHPHPQQSDVPDCPPLVTIEGDADELPTCCHKECDKQTDAHCKYCVTSFCKDHLEENLCTAENLPVEFNKE